MGVEPATCDELSQNESHENERAPGPDKSPKQSTAPTVESTPIAPPTSPDGALVGSLSRLAAKARIVAQLSGGDVRVLAEELVAGLKALVVPSAEVVPLDAGRARRGR